MIEGGKVHGALGVGLDMPDVEPFTERGVPLVSHAGCGDFLFVNSDHESLYRQGLGYLARAGCRRVALLDVVRPEESLPYVVPDEEERGRHAARRRAERDALAEVFAGVGLDYEAERVIIPGATAGEEAGRFARLAERTEQEQGYEMAAELWGSDNPPDGVLFANDLLASGALAAFRRLGIAPGRDVTVASHANAGSPILFGYEREIARVEVDAAAIVREMFRVLDDAMDGPRRRAEDVRLQPTLREP
jgi:DNA-binding LacI/PurR family transcriptional regulator